MSDSFSPTFKNTDGVSQQFGGEQTLTWDFTSATGNPMELVVGGSTYFTFDRNGAMQLESNITWNSDSGGDVGAQYTTRPAKVHAATSVAVGAVSGTGDGSSLTLNRLTLGHGDVDKYVDAEQGLVSTPFIRYNAVNARWEYSDDGITDYPFGLVFGVLDWDSLYAASKSLNINSSTLTWVQTSTTDSAFDIFRDKDLNNTDSPIVIIEQRNAGDDQPGLALGQAATTTSALDIYEGTVTGGTRRFSFIAEGQFGIVTNTTLAAAAISVNQADDDEAFVLATGTAAADASKNVSTANNPTADMIRVDVDGGGGAATRWVPAYSSHVLPGAPTWDAIYSNNKHLNIDGAVLQFEQTALLDYAFEIFRDKDLTFTDSPIVYMHNDNTGDDQSTLYVTGGIGNVTGGVDVLSVAATSDGFTAGTEELRGVASTVTADGTDAGGWLASFYADATTAGTSEAYGLYTTTGPTYGIYSNSPVFITDNTATNVPLEVNQDDSTGALAVLHDTASNNMFEFYSSGELVATHTVAGAAGSATAGDHAAFGTVSSGLTSGTLDLITATYIGSGSDVNGAIVNLFSTGYVVNGSPLTDVRGYYAESDLDYGFWMESTGNFTIGSTTPFMDFDGNPQAAAAGNISTDEAGTADMLRVDVEGNTRWIPAYNATTFTYKTWGAIYANDKYLDIDGAVLQFEQTATTGYGFEVFRNKTAGSTNAAIMRVYNSNTSDDQAALFVAHGIGAVTGGVPALDVEAKSAGMTGGTEELYGVSSLVVGNGSDAAGSALTSFYADASSAGSSTDYGFYATSNFDYGVYSLSPSYTETGAAEIALQCNQTASGDILSLTGGGADKLVVDYTGAEVHTPSNPTASYNAYDLTLSSGGIGDSTSMRGLDISLAGNVGDNAVGTSIYGAYFDLTLNSTSVPTIQAIHIDSNWNYGIYSDSPAYIESSSSTVSALVVNQTTTPNILELQESTSSRFVVDNTGATTLTGSDTIPDFGLSIALSSAGNNDTIPFVQYKGTSNNNNSTNISTANGDGAVEGPKNKSTVNGWSFEGMVKIDVNSISYWMPYYSYDTTA